jgi:hypothetical protein
VIILRHITLASDPLDERSARRRDLYLTTHNNHKKQISMPPPLRAGFEPTTTASEQPQTPTLDRADTGISSIIFTDRRFNKTDYRVLPKLTVQVIMQKRGDCLSLA